MVIRGGEDYYYSSPAQPSTVSSDWDWDHPFTDKELQGIDSIIQSAISSSSSQTKIRHPKDDEYLDDRPKSRRRLPNSVFPQKAALADSSSLLTCPNNRFFHIYHSSCQATTVMKYPEMSFGGEIVYCRTSYEVEKSAEELLNLVKAKKNEVGQPVLGFDIEWKPTFRRGVPAGKAAVMQICGDSSKCYVMHIIHSGIPKNLQSLLMDPTVIKVGVCIANDAFKVLKDHNVSIEALEDLSDLANHKLIRDPKKWSLASLTETLICKQLPKPPKIRLGNWEADVLTKEQLLYAATDAFASWYLCQALKSLPDAVDNKKEVESTLQE